MKRFALILTVYCLSVVSAHAQMQYFTVQSGTGFFINREYVVTNAHVVKGCTKVSMAGAVNEKESEVTVVDEQHDLALIRSSAEPPEFAPMRMDIDTLKVDDNVMIIGYPGEAGMHGQYTVAQAQVQKLELNRVGNPWQFYITDVVEHGNSGGPVLDTSGNVIGVVVGKMQLSTLNANTNEKLSEEHLGVVISLKALQRFVEDQGIYIQGASSGSLTLGEDLIENNAKSYIVNVQCRQETSEPPAQAEEQQ